MDDDPWVGTWRPHRPRGPIAALYGSPGPKYGLPPALGYHLHDISRHRAPAYSFGRKEDIAGKERSPGPVYMLPPKTTARGRDFSPAFSIHSRPQDLSLHQTPGPGRYNLEPSNKVVFPTPPAYTLRSRTRHFSGPQTPGPAAYRLPPLLGPRLVSKPSPPNFSMTGRSEVGTFYQDLRKTPAPCTYQVVDTDVYRHRAPKFSIIGRDDPAPLPATPGPSDYSPAKEKPRGVTFGIRHSPYVTTVLEND
ncbi:ciliary microtubule associated protein 1B isoform X2 [Heliangelus exortis]